MFNVMQRSFVSCSSIQLRSNYFSTYLINAITYAVETLCLCMSLSLPLAPYKLSLIGLPEFGIKSVCSNVLFDQELDHVVEELEKIAVVNLLQQRSIISLIGNAQRSSLILEKVFFSFCNLVETIRRYIYNFQNLMFLQVIFLHVSWGLFRFKPFA